MIMSCMACAPTLPASSSHRRRSFEPVTRHSVAKQIGERRTDRLMGESLVIQEARAGIDLETVDVAIGRLLEVNAREQQVHLAGVSQARFGDGGWQRSR